MLRSEHIPFNFFVPLAHDFNYARDILNKFLIGIIDSINVIRIEYAPDKQEKEIQTALEQAKLLMDEMV